MKIIKNNILKSIRSRRRLISSFFIINFLFELVSPLKLYALTGGPTQPEVSSFEPVGTTEMVDLFSGDFTYNIPLFDIGGYPVNISYHAGISMDQEASWVGLGWNINPGAINRGMRGVPDDFISEDVKKRMNIKKNTTLGVNFNTDLEIFGFIGGKKRKNSFRGYKQDKAINKLSKSNFGFGVVFNNYRGIGYSLDLSTELNKTTYMSETEFMNKTLESDLHTTSVYKNNTHENKNIRDLNVKEAERYKNLPKISKITKKNSKDFGKISLNASSNNGAKFGMSLSMSYSVLLDYKMNLYRTLTPSIGLGYNSLLGVSSFDIGLNKGKRAEYIDGYGNYNVGSGSRSINSYIPIGMYSYVPNISMSTFSTSNSFNATVGFDAFGGHPNMRLSGFYNTEELEKNEVVLEAYGYLYEQESYWNRGKDYLLMDFNREKESNGNKNSTHLPITNHTYDIFSVSGQGNGGMYRPHRKTIGIVHDKFTRNRNKSSGMNDLGIELGFGANFRFGLNYKNKVQRSSSGLWFDERRNDNVIVKDEDNELIELLNYRMEDSKNNRRNKQFYFKAAGEQTPSDNNIGDIWGGKEEVSLRISKTGLARNLRFGKIEKKLYQRPYELSGYTEDNAIRNNVITFLTAEEASHSGLGMDPSLISYPQNYWTRYIRSQEMPEVDIFSRYGGQNGAKAHHVSEIITTGGDGMRYVYGLPAYNKKQLETSFAISKDILSDDTTDRTEDLPNGLVEYSPTIDNSINNSRGSDNYYMQTEMPPYAHSYLLTGVLSPDYADLTGNGITDDDYGSAVKFNYHKIQGNYRWRTPYEQNKANLDVGYLTDNTDNKGSYVYGEKEIWYLQSMESKTHIAEFKLSKRHDGHGVLSENGGLDTSGSNCLMKLDSIVIFSKLDVLVNGPNAKPVKTIVFQYDYSLCEGIPNSDNSQGKLTLKSIYFTYGNSGKGVLNPYRFVYSDFNPDYSHVHYDKWGNYKYADERLANRDFPYTDMDSSRATYDKYSSAWNLSRVRLPSGGEIDIEYEADDYAFVQDRRAMQMVKVLGASHRATTEYTKLNEFLKINSDLVWFKKKNTIIKSNLYDNGQNNNYIYFKLNEDQSSVPSSDQNKWLIDRYLRSEDNEPMPYLYFRFKVNMDPRAKSADHFEYVSGYAEIDVSKCGITPDKQFGFIKLLEINQGDVGITKCNPIAKQAWQMGLQNLRKVIYPGSDQSQSDEDGKKQSALKALVNSYAQVLNLFTGPYQNLRWKHIAKNFEVGKSFIRLYKPDNFKVGGGCRVKRITINDKWNEMNTDQESGEYGQEFHYVTKNGKGEVVSSGVASYEPFVGGDENPFRVPSFYSTNRFMFPNLNEYIEEPFGESFFPSANVGYSRVVVRNIPKPGSVATSTGKVVHEFYTYKDFPLITKNTPLKYLKNGNGNSSDENHVGRKRSKKYIKALTSLFSVTKREYMVATQGYTILLNDMHGKPKSTAIYSSLGEEGTATQKLFNGRLISGTEYKYKTNVSSNAENFNQVFNLSDTARFTMVPTDVSLNNKVWVMKENGELVEKEIATTYDVAVETRQSKSHYRHAGFDFNLENFLILSIPCPYPKYIVNQDLFQSAVVTKVVQQYGVLEEVIAYDHSSIVRTKNLVWDEQTGQVLLTATTNEFEDPIYNFSYPAHLAYDGMGPAYKNIDYETTLIVGSNGDADVSYLTDSDKGMFVEGDELLVRSGEICKRAWVLKTVVNQSTGQYALLRIVDIAGIQIGSGTWEIRVIRSGRRNLSSAPVGAITSMYRKIFDKDSSDRLTLNRDIVQASAVTYSDRWQGYLDKAAYLKTKCDTLKLGMIEAYQLLESMVETGEQEEYYYDGSNLPPNANTLDSYTGALKQSVVGYANSLNVTECPNSNKSISDIYLGRDLGSPDIFYFKSRYICQPSGSTVWRNLTCEFSIEKLDPECDLLFDSLDNIGNFTTISSSLGHFTGYSGTDSCIFKLNFSNQCFYKVNCKYEIDCDYFAGKVINPYVNNIRGVWRQKEAFAYNSGRRYVTKSNNNTNIRKDGLIEDYQPFWNFKDSSKIGLRQSHAPKWISTGTATLYAPEGNGLEEKDALGIYSSQIFGYNNLMVTAQASNARHSQIAFDNFEDYFSPYVGCSRENHFDFRKGLQMGEIQKKSYDNYLLRVICKIPILNEVYGSSRIAKDTAHTGLFSLCVKSGNSHSTIRRIDYSGLEMITGNDSLFRMSSMDDMITTFAPQSGRYVISSWIYQVADDQNSLNSYNDAYLNVKVYNSGSAVVDRNFAASGSIIDKWQRVEGVFDIPSGADSIRVTFVNAGSRDAYFDDIRIHPYDSKMVGHVYDYVNLKVMAELDENNYATFYEYDDEGSLIRIKRETEKGIMTIQESRKSIKKKSN